jgi:hypothetical protein
MSQSRFCPRVKIPFKVKYLFNLKTRSEPNCSRKNLWKTSMIIFKLLLEKVKRSSA